MNKKIIITITLFILAITLSIIGFNLNQKEKIRREEENLFGYKETESVIKEQKEIELINLDGNKTHYTFIYKNETYNAIYTEDNWKIIDSYKIKNKRDMTLICEKLIEEHPIHGRDMRSYRTPSDMAYEWLQHNIAYEILPEDNTWRKNAKDVDINPSDQGKTLIEMYEEKTGKKFNLKDLK